MPVMAQKVEVRLVDDLDGTEANQTVTFCLDGTEYEIDLSGPHATELRQALDTYIESGRKLGRSTVQRGRRTPSTPTTKANREQSQAIRDWAKRKGLEVSDRGRISQEIVERYRAEAGK